MTIHAPNTFKSGPDEQGMFGIFGGRFVAETLMPNILELGEAYEAEVENKVASDYSHIVWAYGIIWTLFAVYGAILWWRSSTQKTDLDDLATKLDPR